VEITKEALSSLVKDNLSKVVEINWQKTKINYNPKRGRLQEGRLK